MVRKKLHASSGRALVPSLKAKEAEETRWLFDEGQMIAVRNCEYYFEICIRDFMFILGSFAALEGLNFDICKVDEHVCVSDTHINVIFMDKVGDRKFAHDYPGTARTIDVRRFICQVPPDDTRRTLCSLIKFRFFLAS